MRKPLGTPSRPATVKACVAACLLMMCWAIVFARSEAQEADKPQPPLNADSESAEPSAEKPADGAAAKAVDLTSEQANIGKRYQDLEKVMLRMAELIASNDPRRAALLRQAVARSKDRAIDGQFGKLVDLLKQERLSPAVKGQAEVHDDLNQILELLLSEDRGQRIESEKEKIREYIKRVNKLIKAQKGVQGGTAGQGDTQELSGEQLELAKKTGEVADDLKKDAGKNQKSKPSGDDASKQDEQPKDGGQEPAQDGDESKGKPGDTKPGEGKPGEGKPNEVKPDKSDDQKPADDASKPGDKKPQEDQKPGDTKSDKNKKPGDDSKSDKPSEPIIKPSDAPKEDAPQAPSDSDNQPNDGDQKSQPQKSKPQNSKPQKSQGEPKPGGSESDPQDSPPPDQQQDDESPTRKQLQQARKYMEEAKKKLDDAKRDEAFEKQQDALENLYQAIAELERILRQLREEELTRTLAMLETRFRKMLDMENDIYDGTKRLDKIPAPERDRDHEVEAGRLSRKQAENVGEADRALAILREEGSAVALPEAVGDMRDDMEEIVVRLAQMKVGQLTQSTETDVIAALEEIIGTLEQAQKDLEKKKQQPMPPMQQQGDPGDQPLVDQIAELKMIRALQMRVNKRTQRYAEMTETEQADKPDLIKALQRLAEREQRVHKVTRDIVVGRNQ